MHEPCRPGGDGIAPSKARAGRVLALALLNMTALASWGVSCAPLASRTGGVHGESARRGVVIDFVSLGGIRDWRAEGTSAMQIRTARGIWYRATFTAPCRGIQFRDTVAFVTEGPDQLTRFSSILADGERCWFKSLEVIRDDVDPQVPEAPPAR